MSRSASHRVEVRHVARGDQSPAPVTSTGSEENQEGIGRGSDPAARFKLAILHAHALAGELPDQGGGTTRALVAEGLLEDVRREGLPGEPARATRLTAKGAAAVNAHPMPKGIVDPPRVLLTRRQRQKVEGEILGLIGPSTTSADAAVIRLVALQVGRPTAEEVRHG